MNRSTHLLRLQLATALVCCCLSAPGQAEVAFAYSTNADARKIADGIVSFALDASAITQPSEVAGEALNMSGPTPGMKRYTAAHQEKLALLDRAAILGHPAAMLMKCYMGAEARAPQWIVEEGVAWCSIIINEVPATMGKVREAAQRAMDDYRKTSPRDAQPDAGMLATLHQRLAKPGQQGPIQSVDPALVVKQGMPIEKLIGLTLFYLGRDFTDYLGSHDLDRAFFNQRFAVAVGTVIKLDDYAKFATAYNFNSTLSRHPQLAKEAL
jgi:hypothetical protein